MVRLFLYKNIIAQLFGRVNVKVKKSQQSMMGVNNCEDSDANYEKIVEKICNNNYYR